MEWLFNGCSISPDPALGDSSPSLPAVDVVILTWNDGPLLETAVQSALVDTTVATTVFVIDNASDVAPSIPKDAAIVLERNPENRGVAAGRNQGAALGSAPFILLLDSDAELEPDCLHSLLDTMLNDPTIAMAVPVYAGQPATASAGRQPSVARKLARGLGLTANYRADRHGHGPVWAVDFGIGACQLVRRDAWEAVGGLDQSFFYGPEDVDFCLRLGDLGHRIVQTASAVCRHPARRRNRSLLARGGIRHARALTTFYARRARQFPRRRTERVTAGVR